MISGIDLREGCIFSGLTVAPGSRKDSVQQPWFYFVRNRLCIERHWMADRAERNMPPRQGPLAMRRYMAIQDQA